MDLLVLMCIWVCNPSKVTEVYFTVLCCFVLYFTIVYSSEIPLLNQFLARPFCPNWTAAQARGMSLCSHRFIIEDCRAFIELVAPERSTQFPYTGSPDMTWLSGRFLA